MGKVLSILLAYRGRYSFEVGLKIALLVQRFESKYPSLRDIFHNYQDHTYSTFLKMIPFELILGIPLDISSSFYRQCKADSEQDTLAREVVERLHSYSSELVMFREVLEKELRVLIYWHPCETLRQDPYLNMF